MKFSRCLQNNFRLTKLRLQSGISYYPSFFARREKEKKKSCLPAVITYSLGFCDILELKKKPSTKILIFYFFHRKMKKKTQSHILLSLRANERVIYKCERHRETIYSIVYLFFFWRIHETLNRLIIAIKYDEIAIKSIDFLPFQAKSVNVTQIYTRSLSVSLHHTVNMQPIS